MTHFVAATNLILFFGHFHPLMVHLPIGLLAALAVLELADRVHHFKHAAQARGLILFLVVVSSVTAVVLGLMLASGGGYDPHLLAWHKWTGIALAGCCCLTAVSFWTRHHRPYVGLLMVTLLLLTPAAHYGGSMTHGKDYLTEYAPNWVRSLAGERATAVAAAGPARPKVTDAARAVAFADVVQPILAKDCASCHGPEKLKGELRVDSFAALKKGGKTGPAFVAGKSSDSLMVERMLLSPDDDKHMPPDGKPQPTDDQLAILQWWIDSGAPVDKRVGDLDPPVTVADAIAKSLGLSPAGGVQTDPVPWEQIAPQVAQASAATGAVITRISQSQPWLSVNAAVARSFGDAEMARLAPLSRNIVWLNLAFTKVTDAGLAPVAGMANLQQLRLERTGVSDAALKHVARLRKLDYLNLYSTNVTDAGLKTLAGLPALRHLYLWKTKVTGEAAKAFAAGKTDRAKMDRINRQIAALQAQLRSQAVEVVEGVQAPASTAPAAAVAVAKAAPAAPSPAVAVATNAATVPVAINKICPVTGKPIDPTKFVDYKGKRIAFCCDDCPAEFRKNPAKYADKLLLASAADTAAGAAKPASKAAK